MQERLKVALLEAIKLRLKGRNLVCGICGGTRWQLIGVSNTYFNQTLADATVVGGPHIPITHTCCENCGNTIQFNIIGLLGGLENYNHLKQECIADAIIEQALQKP